jgi:hypothetical protein
MQERNETYQNNVEKRGKVPTSLTVRKKLIKLFPSEKRRQISSRSSSIRILSFCGGRFSIISNTKHCNYTRRKLSLLKNKLIYKIS